MTFFGVIQMKHLLNILLVASSYIHILCVYKESAWILLSCFSIIIISAFSIIYNQEGYSTEEEIEEVSNITLASSVISGITGMLFIGIISLLGYNINIYHPGMIYLSFSPILPMCWYLWTNRKIKK